MNYFHRLGQWLSHKRSPATTADDRAERGQLGEDLAARYCKRELGYRIIVRNWRCQRDEVDLICRDGATLVFIEVRARSADALVSGYHSVTPKKKRALHRAFRNYLYQLQKPPKHFRFDIIDVALRKDGTSEVRHFSDVPIFHKRFSAQPK